MPTLLRQRVVGVWALLVVATLLSWGLGSHHGTGSRELSAGVVLAVACVKVRLVGLHFMELRGAPSALRLAFEVYVVTLFGLLLGLYLAA